MVVMIAVISAINGSVVTIGLNVILDVAIEIEISVWSSPVATIRRGVPIGFLLERLGCCFRRFIASFSHFSLRRSRLSCLRIGAMIGQFPRLRDGVDGRGLGDVSLRRGAIAYPHRRFSFRIKKRLDASSVYLFLRVTSGQFVV